MPRTPEPADNADAEHVDTNTKDPELVALGAHLRRLRRAAGLTQERLANAADIHWTYVGQVERGTRNPTYKNLLKLARGLDVPIETLVQAAH